MEELQVVDLGRARLGDHSPACDEVDVTIVHRVVGHFQSLKVDSVLHGGSHEPRELILVGG
jgi:hypothetical protein